MTGDLPDLRRRLVPILGRLGSDHAGERDNAARIASRMIREAGATWEEVLAPPPAPFGLVVLREARTAPPPAEPPSLFSRLSRRAAMAQLAMMREWPGLSAADHALLGEAHLALYMTPHKALPPGTVQRLDALVRRWLAARAAA